MAFAIDEQYVVHKNGDPVGVILDIGVYRKILEELEELAAIRAYDAAKASGDEAIPFEQAIEEIAPGGRR
jgi:hypothetical protein